MGNIWFVIPLLSVNKLINTYSVYDVSVAYVTGRVTVYGPYVKDDDSDDNSTVLNV